MRNVVVKIRGSFRLNVSKEHSWSLYPTAAMELSNALETRPDGRWEDSALKTGTIGDIPPERGSKTLF
jgi:hypothetical protein